MGNEEQLEHGNTNAKTVQRMFGAESLRCVGWMHRAGDSLNPPGESGDLALLRKEVLSHV